MVFHYFSFESTNIFSISVLLICNWNILAVKKKKEKKKCYFVQFFLSLFLKKISIYIFYWIILGFNNISVTNAKYVKYAFFNEMCNIPIFGEFTQDFCKFPGVYPNYKYPSLGIYPSHFSGCHWRFLNVQIM